mgnify:FL=1|jgi:hypothetical protein
MILQIKRGNKVIAESADFSFSSSLQEVRKLTCEVVSVIPIQFKAYNSKSESEYDTVVYNGNTFILYQAPSGDNLNEAGKYKYSLLFYGKEVLLQNVAFLDIVSGTGGEINQTRYTHGGLFQFWGDAKQLAARIEANIESYNSSLGAGYTGIGTWTLNVDAEGDLTEDMIDISDGTNLFDGLKNFYDKFYLNYYFSTTANGGVITITDKARPSIDWTFKQGDGDGAVKVSSSVDTSTPVITRIIPQGGSRNVPPDYKKDAKPVDESRYCPYILLPNDSSGNIRYYLDSEYGLKNYGVRGKTVSNTFSGVYPSIRGKKLEDLYPSGLPEWDTYTSAGEPDPQSGKVAGKGVSASTRIDKIIGSTPIKSDDSDSFFIYMTSPGFNLGYKVYEDGDSSDKINDNVNPQYKPHAMFDKYKDSERFDIYGTRVYYDQPVKVTATFSGKMLFSILPVGSDAVGKKVKINLRMVINRLLGQASSVKEVVIGEEGATDMLEIPFDKTVLTGYIEKGQNTTVSIGVEFTFDSDVPAGSCKIGFSEEMTCNIHFGNQDGSQDRFYFKYASVTDAVFSMRTGTYTGTEFKINKNGIIPLYGEVSSENGETEEDVAMFNKGARYKISCYRTDSDNAKLPLYTDGSSPAISEGTEFVILNIVMPKSYETMAENTLEKVSRDYLSRYDHENRTVSLDISSGFVAEHPNLFINFIEGNMLKVRDDGIGVFDFSDNGQIVDMQLQIQSLEIKYSKDNLFPSYSCTIARRKILSFYERLAQENQTVSTQNTTNVTLGGSGTGSGTNIFSEQLLNDLIASFQKFNGWFEWDEEKQALRCKSALYTNQWISALGAQSGGGSSGGGGIIQSVYGFADLGKTFNNDTLTDTFNAYTINEIWKLAKEGGMNADKLWQELGKDDATKKIHISHLPDNKYVTIDTEQTVTANKIFTGQLSTANIVPSVNNASTLGLDTKRWENIYSVSANISGTITSNNVKTNSLQVGDIKIVYDSTNKAVTFEHIDGSTTIGLYTKGWISALGVSPGGGGGGSGLINNVYGYSSLGTTFSDSDLDNTFNAYTINEIWKMAKEGGGIKNITPSGSGNAVTDMSLSSDGKTITVVFGEVFAKQQDLGTLNNTVTQLSNKLNDFLEGSDTDNIINKWKELEAFLEGLTESDNLADLLALKADKTITISAGAGLTGGGNLSANRTISLATSGVKAGTYTKVTVDTYGRVTVGDNPTTLAGYGITDAVTLTTAQTISGQKTFTKNILMNSGTGLSYDENTVFRNTSGNTIIASYGDGMIYFRPNGHNNTEGAVWISKTGYLNGVSAGFTGGVSAARLTANEYIQIGDAQLVYDSANKALRVKHRADGNTVGFYSDGWVSALGVKTGGSGGGSGVVNTVYSFANLTDGTTFSDSDLDNTFNAYTIKKLYDMAGQGGLDADAMWAELKKADSSKIIDASHIPTSVLDGRWVKKAGDTMTGTLTSASTTGSIIFKGLENCDITNIYTNNGTLYSDTSLAIRNGLRFNWYDTYWYIGNLRGASTNSSGFGIANESNKLCLQVTPDYTTAPVFRSSASQGTAPLIVYSTTQVSNLNADLLDGQHGAYYQNRVYDTFVSQHTQYDYIEFLRFVIPNGQNELRAYVVFDLCRTETGNESSGRAVLRLRRYTDNTASTLFYVTNFGRTTLPELRCTSNDGIIWRIWMKCNKSIDDPYIAVKIIEQYPYGYVTTQNNGTTGTPEGTRYVFTALSAGISNAANFLVNSRTLWGQPFNGTANVSGDMTGVGSITMSGNLKIGNATSPNTIYFYGTTGDEPGGYNHTFIAERVWGGTESGELVLFKGNDIGNGTDAITVSNSGPDRIRHIAAAHLFQTYTTVLSGSVESVCTSSALKNLFSIASNRVISYVQLQSTIASGIAPFIVASNTVVSNLNADLLDGQHLSDLDGRYVNVTGDTMTGDLTMNNTKGFNIGWSTRVVKTSGVWIHGGADAASSTDANLRFASCYGIGWYPTISGQTVTQGNNAMWLNVRTGVLNVAGGIKESSICIGRVNSSGNYDAAYNGEINRYENHLLLQHHSGQNLIMCNGGGLAGIGTGSPRAKLDVAGNVYSTGFFYSTVGTGTAPYQCSSTTLNTNLNADLLDGYHQTAFTSIIGRHTLYTSGTAPYNYIHLFRIANSSGYSTLRVDIDIKTRNHRAILYVDIVSGQYAYGDNGTSVYISKFQVNGLSARLWYKITKQTSGYNYIDFYYQSGAWNSGSFDIVSRSSNGILVFEPKSTNMDNLPSGCTEVGKTVFDGSITGNAATASRLQTAHNINGTTFDGTANITTSYWGTTRTFYTNSHDSYMVSAGVNVNGSGNVTLLLPSSIRCSDWFRSTGNTGWYHENYGGGWYMADANYIRNYNSKRLRIQTDTYDTIQLVRTSGSGGSSIAFYNGGGTFRGQFGMNATSWFTFDTGTATANQNVVEISPAGGIHSKAEITAKASGSDIRLKKDIQNYNAMDIINKFRSVKYHWNDVAKANSEVYNNDYDQFGLIAQDLIAGGFEQWVRDVFHDYYTVTYERLIPVVWKGLQEVDDEVTRLKKRVRELENRLGIYNQ